MIEPFIGSNHSNNLPNRKQEQNKTHKFRLLCRMSRHTCIISGNGWLKCWGRNLYGQLGLGDKNDRGDQPNEMGTNLPFVNVGDGLIVDQISTGGFHTCAHFTNNQIKCWGYNLYGQLGLGIYNESLGTYSLETPDKLAFVNLGTEIYPTTVVCGYSFTCILLNNKRIKCFGSNQFGDIGYEDVSYWGKQMTKMGDNLPFVDLGNNILVDLISTSAYSDHTCVVITSSQLMKCWGNNEEYQLGYGDDMHRGKEVNTMGDFLPTINLGDEDRVKQMAVGDYFVCALRIDDELKCWGSNSNGQIGIGSTKSNVASMGDSLISTPFDSGKKIKQIFAGKSQMCILYDDSITVKCVGDNSYGQLGTGDKFNRGDSDLTTIPNITAIDLGTGELQIANVILSFKFVCIEFADKRVKCFGYNEEGNLGYNNFEDLSDKAGGIGSNLKFVDLFQSITLPTNNPTCSPT